MPVILGGNTGIYLASSTPPAPSFVGLLDTYPNAAVAYSLRKLSSTYSGNCIRVRRSSDNTEQDISFVGNDLDTTSMLDFVGYNMWTYSEDISQSVWSKNFLVTSGTPPYIDVETAPDGTLTGDKMIESTSVGYNHFITRQTTPITIGANYNLSLYLKQGERTTVSISSNIAGTAQSCRINLINGSISSNTFVNTPTVTAEANGWYRFSVTIVAGTSNATQSIAVTLINASGQSVYTGDGTSGAYVWGFQLSQTSSVKTYQKTVATAGGSGFVTTWYDQSGNGLNSSMSTAIQQPRIVNAGSIDLVNSKPAILADGIDDTLRNTTLSLSNPSSIFTVVDKVGTTGNFGLFANTGNLAGAFILTATGYTFYQNGAAFSPAYVNNNQSLLVAKTATTGTNWELYGNNTTVTNGGQNIGTEIGTAISLFDRGTSSRCNMYMQEFIVWGSNQMTNRAAIQTEINSYYNIYP